MNKAIPLLTILMGMLGACSGRDNGAGEFCECNTQCVSGLYCADSTGRDIPEDDNGFGGSCTGHGTCVPLRSAGEACDDGIPCDRGLQCIRSEPRTCELPQTEGAPCADERDCASGLSCNGALDVPRCAAPGGVGDPCGNDGDCDQSLTCNQSNDPPRCEVPQSVPEGGPCSDDVQCAENLLCYNTGRCVPVGDNGANYYPGTSTCVQRLSVAPGEICNRDEECRSGQCIKTVSGICTPGSCS